MLTATFFSTWTLSIEDLENDDFNLEYWKGLNWNVVSALARLNFGGECKYSNEQAHQHWVHQHFCSPTRSFSFWLLLCVECIAAAAAAHYVSYVRAPLSCASDFHSNQISFGKGKTMKKIFFHRGVTQASMATLKVDTQVYKVYCKDKGTWSTHAWHFIDDRPVSMTKWFYFSWPLSLSLRRLDHHVVQNCALLGLRSLLAGLCI